MHPNLSRKVHNRMIIHNEKKINCRGTRGSKCSKSGLVRDDLTKTVLRLRAVAYIQYTRNKIRRSRSIISTSGVVGSGSSVGFLRFCRFPCRVLSLGGCFVPATRRTEDRYARFPVHPGASALADLLASRVRTEDPTIVAR